MPVLYKAAATRAWRLNPRDQSLIGAIYIEDSIAEHPRMVEICGRLPRVPRIPCKRYGEVRRPTCPMRV